VPSHLAATEAAEYAAAPAPPPRARLLRRSTPAEPAPAADASTALMLAEAPPETNPPPEAEPPPEAWAAPNGEKSPAPDAPVVAETLPPLDDLVAGINTVGFAPGAADEEQARRAGDQVVAYAAALRGRRSWWRRWWWSVHPGPLRWNRQR
jgi:hypothetical protein